MPERKARANVCGFGGKMPTRASAPGRQSVFERGENVIKMVHRGAPIVTLERAPRTSVCRNVLAVNIFSPIFVSFFKTILMGFVFNGLGVIATQGVWTRCRELTGFAWRSLADLRSPEYGFSWAFSPFIRLKVTQGWGGVHPRNLPVEHES
jgi:hypothetical protein